MLLLGIDLGTSSIKVSVVDAATQQSIAATRYPETETEILAPLPGWAEQDPETWWHFVQQAILKLHAQKTYNPKDIAAIGIAYQMHGLVLVDNHKQCLRNSIIWCDSRAVDLGDKAFETIGKEKCLRHLLNSPGNFTASKLAWVKQNEPELYQRVDKIMLPGDYIAMKLTGALTTTIAALSEGIFWDFQNDELSTDVFSYFGFHTSLIPEIKNVFSEHGRVTAAVASALSLKEGIPVTYKAGDQPNNAWSLNVLQSGEVAATAGTSGVIYGVTDQLTYDTESRVNTFAHINYTPQQKKLGVLLCINGTGILNRWIKTISGDGLTYDQINEAAQHVPPGSEGLLIFPFGNGAERILHNKRVQAHIQNIDLNKHKKAHVFRAAQEGIIFAFRYGMDILRENGMHPQVIRAGKTNMFLSKVFAENFANALKVPVELYSADGSVGAALGAGVGAGIFANLPEAFQNFKPIHWIEPTQPDIYDGYYHLWVEQLQKHLS